MWFWIGLRSVEAQTPCHTMDTWQDWQPRTLVHQRMVKSEREHIDGFDTPLDRVQFSDNFAVHWGTDLVDTTSVTDVLSLLEETWRMQVEVWGMQAPVEDTYFNVYLGGTGDGMPSDLGVAGYYDVDDNGYPMVVLGPYVIESWSIGQTTIPHEFFHAVQHRTGQFTLFQDRWYWEASATWVEQEVLPAHPSHADFLFGYALRPYLPLAHFELFSNGNIEEYHPYGAFIFLQYLTDFHVDEQDVVLSWTEVDVSEDTRPLDWWNQHLANQQLSFGALISDMAAHNVHWDYPNQIIYETKVEAYAASAADVDERIAGTLRVEDEIQTVPSRLRPGAYGYNYWEFDLEIVDDTQTAELYFDGTTVGDHFNDVIWRLELVQERIDGIVYQSLHTDDGEGLWDVELQDLQDATLIVFADSREAHIDETFTYSLQLRSIEDTDKRMGCTTLSTQSWPLRLEQGLLIWLVPGVLLLRRRLQPSSD